MKYAYILKKKSQIKRKLTFVVRSSAGVKQWWWDEQDPPIGVNLEMFRDTVWGPRNYC